MFGIPLWQIEVAALTVGVVAELIGVWRSKHGKVDTYTEIVAWLGERFDVLFLPIMVALTVLMLWAIVHLWVVVTVVMLWAIVHLWAAAL